MPADPAKLKSLKDLGTRDILFSVARLPNSERLFCGSSDFKVYTVDMAAEKPALEALTGEGHQSYVTGLALAGRQLVSGSYDGRLIWWDTDSKQQVRAVDAHEKWIRRVVTTPDGKIIASVADDMACKLWDAATGNLLATLNDHQPVTPNDFPSMLYAVAVSADGTLLATGDKIGHVAVWELPSGKKVGEVESPGMYTWDPRQRIHSIGGIRSLAFSPDAKTLAVGGIGKIGNIDHLDGPARIELFDWREGKSTRLIEDTKFKGLVERLAFLPDSTWLASTGGDHKGFLSFWDPATGNALKQESAHQHCHDFVFDETYERLYTVHHGKVAAWELKA